DCKDTNFTLNLLHTKLMYRKEVEMKGQMTRTVIADEYIRVLDLQRREPDLAFLTDINRRHVAQFAFSSVGPLLGDELPLDVESLYQRIVINRRGGYCFEQNALMFAMLEELGFKVQLYLGRVIYNQDIHPPLTHRITLVDFGEDSYVIDVGFGPLGPQLPVCMSGEVSQQNFRSFRIEERLPGVFHMQTLKDGEYYSLYKFELAHYGPADCELGHFYSHKHPLATFVNHLVVSRILDKEVRSLRNHEFGLMTESGEQRQLIEDEVRLRGILNHQFGIRVTEAEARRLFEKTTLQNT
ncbi:MAG: arylamine N-acetyltransferase, partial [Lysobacterales bacterium]